MTADVARDPRWFVENYDAARNAFSFVPADRDTKARQPFLDQRWNRQGLERREVALDTLAAQLPPGVRPGVNFIWHASFCLSTLIAELLDAPGRGLSLREPLVMVSVADAKRAGQFGGPTMPPRLVELMLRLFAQSSGSERPLVKPSNFANNLIPEAVQLSEGKMLFLYADLESFLISMAKGGDGLGKYARRLFSSLIRDSGAPPRWPLQEILHMSDLEIAALCWHMQIAQFDRSAKSLGTDRMAALDCGDFLADPTRALTALSSFFQLDMSAKDITAVVEGPALRRHAKVPTYPFGFDQRRKLADDVRTRLGPDLPRIAEWSHRMCPETRQSTMLSGARLAKR